jgi:transcriptional regulator with XRE-family HTH domain
MDYLSSAPLISRPGDDVVTEDPGRLFAWLEACRDQPGWRWSQKQMAEACAVTPNGMRGWRNGSMPDRATLTAVATGVGVSVAALHRVMAGEPIPTPPTPPGAQPAEPDNGDLAARLRHLEQRVDLLTDLVLRQRSRH